MDKDRIKGKMEDMGGRVERQVGEWTGDKEKQVEGLKHQAKGKIRNMAGQVKDARRETVKDISEQDNAEVERNLNKIERKVDREHDLDREKGAA